MIASRDGQTGTVKVLVEAGADKEAKTNVRDEKWEDHTLFNGESFMIARQSFMCYMCAQEWCSCLLFLIMVTLRINTRVSRVYTYIYIYIYSFTTLCATYLFPVNFSMAAYFVFLYIIYPRCFYWLSLLWCASLSTYFRMASQRSLRPRTKVSTPQLCRSWWMQALTRRPGLM